MPRKKLFLILGLLLLLSSIRTNHPSASTNNQYPRLTPKELEIITQINGTNTYNFDIELEQIALNPNISHYAFRVAGSRGANEAAYWIKKQFESFGLETSLEPFEFTTWDLAGEPVLVIDEDGNKDTTNDQKVMKSFQPEHYSWPTPEAGVFGQLAVLGLPEAHDINATRRRPANSTLWNAIDTTNKIVLVGRELRYNRFLHQIFVNKLRAQPPAAIIYAWWYEWMSFVPPFFLSVGGLPYSSLGSYFWDLKIPVGWVSYEEGLWIRSREKSPNLSANFTIPAVIASGLHYNVVGKLKGSVDPEKNIIISSHYDTVMTSGFCDNGAGTAGVMELARVFANAAKQGEYTPEQTLLFITFTAEELGLVGSINYVMQHKAEMGNITAVINLDCIGSDNLYLTETFPNENELDLDEIARKSAEDLGIRAELEEATGSDHEVFRNPMMANFDYDQFWGLNADIGNATRVKASIMIESNPLFYSEKWQRKPPGWIHTQYDNSTSTATQNWVEIDDLEAHVEVAALATMRTLAYVYSPFLSQLSIVTLSVSVIFAAGAIYYERSRVHMALKKTYNSILFYIEMKEVVVIVMLTVLFLFLSYLSHTRMGKIEVILKGFPSTLFFEFYGAPYEMIGIEQLTEPPVVDRSEGAAAMEWVGSYQVGTLILWDGLILNILIYFLLAFGLTYTVTRLMHR